MPQTSQEAVNPSPPQTRIASVDIYRGFVMLLMAGEILGFWHLAEAFPNSSFWRFLAFHQSHVEWTGASLHDMIQPSFTFLVGVVLPYSLSARTTRGSSFASLLKHAIIRSLILICLGIFLRSMHSKQTYFTFEDTLTQIGLGYTFLFLISYLPHRGQVVSLILLLAGYWLAFALYTLPGTTFDYNAAGISPVWEHNFSGLAAHWNKNTNFAWAFDRRFLNLFPRENPFTNNGGGYSTLSFIPTLGTMILGLFAGKILKSDYSSPLKIKNFLLIGLILLLAAIALHLTGINPIVKRIWTPAWVLFSAGICFWFLAFFYYSADYRKKKNVFFLFTVIGTNSIAAYVIADGFSSFIANSLYIHLGQNFDAVFGAAYTTLVKGFLVLIVELLILLWLFRKKIFIKI